MDLWNYSHITLHTHVYILLSVVLLAIMIVIALIHDFRQKDREDDNETDLRRISEEVGKERRENDLLKVRAPEKKLIKPKEEATK